MPNRKRKLNPAVGAGVIAVVLATMTISLHAQSGLPEGSWKGYTNGRGHTFVNLTVNGQLCSYNDPSMNLPGNSCSWQQTATTGGILTIYYDTVLPTQTFHNQLYVGITWVNKNQIVARLAPGDDGAATLKRQ
jgi:hypothetical protein